MGGRQKKKGKKQREKQTTSATMVCCAMLQFPSYSNTEGGQGSDPSYFHTYQKVPQFKISKLQKGVSIARLHRANNYRGRRQFLHPSLSLSAQTPELAEPLKCGKTTLPLANPYDLYIQSFTQTYV